MPKCVLGWIKACALMACVSLPGCNVKPDEREPLVAAQQYLQTRDLPSAVIELKNALRAQPESAEVRFLLGRALLDLEDPVAAVVQLTKAREGQYPEEELVPVMAKALLASGDPRKVLVLDYNAKLQTMAAVAQLKTSAAQASAALGDEVAADALIEQALRAQPDHAPAMVVRARLLSNQGHFAASSSLADQVLARLPADPDALVLKGELLEFAKQDSAGAAAAYRAALAAQANHLPAAVALLTQLLTQNDLAAARRQLAALKSTRPKHPQTLYFEARLASAQGDHKTAYDISQALASRFPEDPHILQLAGIAALQHKQAAQAEQYLEKLVKLAPAFVPGRQLLARARVMAGKPEAALDALQPLLDSQAPDGPTLALAGSAQLLAGNESKAEALFERAAKLKHAGSSTELALAQFGKGNPSAGLSQLEAIAKADAGTVADLALIAARLNLVDYAGALQAVDSLERKEPGNAQATQLRAQILAKQGDLPAARAQYEKALANDAQFFPAIDGLAALDMREKKPAQARARFEKLLEDDSANSQALVALAAIDEQVGKPKADVAALLARAVAASPSEALLRRRLVGYHLSKQDFKPALAAAVDAAVALPNDLEILEVLARAQFAAGQTTQALVSYSKLVTQSPKSADAYLGLARAYLGAKDDVAAGQAIRNALGIAPNAVDVVQRAAALYVLGGRFDDAINLARGLQSRKDASAAGDELLGDIEASRKAWAAAAAAYRSAVRKQPTTALAQRLYSSLLETNKPAAQVFAATWTRDHPKDVQFMFHVGGLASKNRDFGVAEATFLQVLKVHPDNALALNNLAWALRGLNKPGAMARAERANQLLPDVPVMMDTWALLLAESNEVEKALQIQKRAVTLSPDAPALRLTLAKIQIMAGDKASAKIELERLRSLGERFDGQQEVAQLLARV